MASEATASTGFTYLDLQHRRASMRRLPQLLGGTLKLVWQAAPSQFVISMGLQFLGGVGVALQLLIGKVLLSKLLPKTGRPSFGDLLPYLLLLAVVSTIVAFAAQARGLQQTLLGALVTRHAMRKIHDVTTTIPLLAYEAPAFHDRLQRANVNAQMRPTQLAAGVLGLTGSLFALAGITAALFVIQPIFVLLVVVAYIPTWMATTRASQRGYDFSVEETERDRRRSYLSQLLTSRNEATELRAFGLAPFLRKRFDDLVDDRIANQRTVLTKQLRLRLIGTFATSLLTAAAVGTLAWFVTSGRIAVAGAATAAAAVVLLGSRLQALASGAANVYEGSLFVEDYLTFVDLAPAIREAAPTGHAPPRFDTLTVEHVSFTYPSSTRPALDDVSIEIRAGEVVALVGENGSGKTTLAKVLAGLWSPESGAVSWDGVDVSAFSPEELRSAVAVIFQNFLQYQLSAADNIAMGRHERFEDRPGVEAAARAVGADAFLQRLPKAYDTNLGPQFYGGTELSVGQWQRIALARAIFRDAPFLILDEPTAALDARAESELFESIRTLAEGRTVLFISHRFSSVRSADRIYVLSGGRIVEEGDHTKLMKDGKLYAELFRLQAAAYLDKVKR